MRKKHIVLSSLAVGILLLLLVFYFILVNSADLNPFLGFIREHTYIGAVFLILIRIAGNIFPVVPGGVISFALVPIFGWFATYLYTAIGIFLGTSIAFWLARIYREHLLSRFVSLQKIRSLEKQMSGRKQFFALVGFRIFAVPVIDISSYVAGFTGISYKKFALATIIATFPDIVIFYVGEEVYKRFFGRGLVLGILAMLIVASSYFIIKRYRFKKQEI